MSLTADQITFISIGAGVIGILIYLAYTALDLFWFVKGRKTIKNTEQALDRAFDRLDEIQYDMSSPADLASSGAFQSPVFQSPVGSGIGGFDPAAMAPSPYGPDPSMAAGVRPEQFLGGGALAQQMPLLSDRYTDIVQQMDMQRFDAHRRQREQATRLEQQAAAIMAQHRAAVVTQILDETSRFECTLYMRNLIENTFGQEGLMSLAEGSPAEPPDKELDPEPEAPIVDMSGKRRIDL